jgi:hypothetical protein
MPPYKEGMDIRYHINNAYLKQKIGSSYFELNIPQDNELPYVNTRFFDMFLRTLSSRDIVSIFMALLEERPILIVCENASDIIPFWKTITDLMYPFEWSLTRIPYLIADPNDFDDTAYDLVVNSAQNHIVGLHKSCYNIVKERLTEDTRSIHERIVINLTNENQCKDKTMVDDSLFGDISFRQTEPLATNPSCSFMNKKGTQSVFIEVN